MSPQLRVPPGEQSGTFPAHRFAHHATGLTRVCAWRHRIFIHPLDGPLRSEATDARKRPMGVSALRHWCQRSHRSWATTRSVTAGSSRVSPSSAHARVHTAITRGGPQATTWDPLQRYCSSPQATGARAPEEGGSATAGSEGDGEQSCRFARGRESGISTSSATHPSSHRPTTSQGHAQLSAEAHGSG